MDTFFLQKYWDRQEIPRGQQKSEERGRTAARLLVGVEREARVAVAREGAGGAHADLLTVVFAFCAQVDGCQTHTHAR